MGCVNWGCTAQSGAGQCKVGMGGVKCRDCNRPDRETDNEAPFVTHFEGGGPMDPMHAGFMAEGGTMPALPPPVALSWTPELGPVLLSVLTVEPAFMRPVTEQSHGCSAVGVAKAAD